MLRLVSKRNVHIKAVFQTMEPSESPFFVDTASLSPLKLPFIYFSPSINRAGQAAIYKFSDVHILSLSKLKQGNLCKQMGGYSWSSGSEKQVTHYLTVCVV